MFDNSSSDAEIVDPEQRMVLCLCSGASGKAAPRHFSRSSGEMPGESSGARNL